MMPRNMTFMGWVRSIGLESLTAMFRFLVGLVCHTSVEGVQWWLVGHWFQSLVFPNFTEWYASSITRLNITRRVSLTFWNMSLRSFLVCHSVCAHFCSVSVRAVARMAKNFPGGKLRGRACSLRNRHLGTTGDWFYEGTRWCVARGHTVCQMWAFHGWEGCCAKGRRWYRRII